MYSADQHNPLQPKYGKLSVKSTMTLHLLLPFLAEKVQRFPKIRHIFRSHIVYMNLNCAVVHKMIL